MAGKLTLIPRLRKNAARAGPPPGAISGVDAARGGVALLPRAPGPASCSACCPATRLRRCRRCGSSSAPRRASTAPSGSSSGRSCRCAIPARVYEIHLMKNVAGFDRRGWRTGFTCYRFAIPDFAGRTGKAIYNDVDQIYLADPALLFDLELDGHGYRAIDARDTSVMLIDCEKMLPWWNRAAASAPRRQGAAHQQARRGAGPVGRARSRTGTPATSNMSRGGPSACTTRPCTSSPGIRSPRPTPITRTRWPMSGTISSAAADAAGFEVFTRDEPARVSRRAGLEPADGGAAGRTAPVVASGRRLLRQTVGARDALGHGLGRRRRRAPWRMPTSRADPPRFRPRGRRLPEGPFDAVVAAGIFERIPGADANWVLRELFAAAGRALVLRIAAMRRRGRRQRGLVAPPGRGDRGALSQGQLAAGRRAAAERPARSRSTATQVRRVDAAGRALWSGR